jgi:hypothetical protein
MKILALGTGNAFTSKNFNQSFLLEENGRKMLIDCGRKFKGGITMENEIVVERVVRSDKYSKVISCYVDEKGDGNANHLYRIESMAKPIFVLGQVNFQNGGIADNGVNGLQNEDLLAIVIDRLQGFQEGKYKCRENAIALTKIQEGLMWLEKRTADRMARGVEGTAVV